MEQIKSLGTCISDVALKTRQIYQPLLVKNADTIKSAKRKTFSYGSHPRQALDVYYPPEGDQEGPILIFLYGGGLIHGDKNQGLVYANLGYFFTQLGYLTIIPDYRLLRHGAKFPSGGEDVAAVLEWVKRNVPGKNKGKARDLYIMGNSAGGIHLSTFLFAPHFAQARNEIVREGAVGPVVLKGVILLSVPFHFKKSLPIRSESLNTYYGNRIAGDCPVGLLRTARLSETLGDLEGVRLFVLVGSLDPEDEIMEPNDEFVNEWEAIGTESSRTAFKFAVMEGQNHISPPLSLGTGIPEEEAWGYLVSDWIEAGKQK